MNRKEFINYHNDLIDEMHIILQKKNADYASSEDVFFNFRQVEALNLASVETGILIRMMDKMSRLSNFVKKGTLEVEDETIKDTCIDLANYALILCSYINRNNFKATEKTPGIPTFNTNPPPWYGAERNGDEKL